MYRVNLISGIPEIWVSGTQQRLSRCSLKFTAQARRGQEGDGDSITHRLKREDSVENHQQTHTPGHAKVLKAQVTLFFTPRNKRICVYVHDDLAIRSLLIEHQLGTTEAAVPRGH